YLIRMRRRSIAWPAPCRAEDTCLGRHRLAFETLHVDDDPYLMLAALHLDRDAVQRRCLDDRAQAVASGIERLSVETSKDDVVGARVDLDAAHHEAFDLVHVQTLIDPRDEQRFGAVGLRANLTRLARTHGHGIGHERKHA